MSVVGVSAVRLFAISIVVFDVLSGAFACIVGLGLQLFVCFLCCLFPGAYSVRLCAFYLQLAVFCFAIVRVCVFVCVCVLAL